MFEQAADGMLLADVNTKKFLMGNEISSKMLGYSPDEIRQLGVMDIHPPEALPYVLEQFERQRKQEIALAPDLPVKRKDGSIFYADINAFPVIIEGKTYLIGVFRDITARRQAEQTLKETNAQLERMVSEGNQRNREATLINGMVEALQSCLSAAEAYPIIAHCAQQLFEFCSGALFMLDPDGNLLEAVTFWGNNPNGEQVFPPDDCWAIRRGKVYLSGGDFHEKTCRHLPDQTAEGYLCIPLVAQGETFGLLQVQTSGKVDASMMGQVKNVAVTIGDNISLALANIRLRETLRHQVIHDPLTGLFNRRYMDETLKREIARVRRKKAPLGVIMMDLDHFKRFNDTYGHEAGDSLLETLGKFLETQVRQEDVACRYGGEEFVLILPEASPDVTQKRAEEIRQGVPQLQVSHRGRMLEMITVSLGVASFPEHGATEDDLLRAADDAMYQAKAEGRNRVVVAKSSMG
jgi:diguanylate cyclase (GGDEF)-like protein/PAS domain S-box-containing protein